jgi:adenylate kinase family enzyme
MDMIVIVGSPGAGKTTFALQLGKVLNIKVSHLDHYFWHSNWKEKPRHIRVEILKNLIQQEEKWIIEGTYLDSSEPRLNAADTIIFLDIPPWLCLQRIIHRYHKYRGQLRRDLPDGCSDNLNWKCILKVLIFPMRGRRMLNRKLSIYESSNHETKQVIRLHSVEEVEVFLAELGNGGSENNTTVEEISLVLSGR